MTDLETLLRDAAPHVNAPDLDDVAARSNRRRRTRRAAAGIVAVAAVVIAVPTVDGLRGDPEPPTVVDAPPSDGLPDGVPTTIEDGRTTAPGDAGHGRGDESPDATAPVVPFDPREGVPRAEGDWGLVVSFDGGILLTEGANLGRGVRAKGWDVPPGLRVLDRLVVLARDGADPHLVDLAHGATVPLAGDLPRSTEAVPVDGCAPLRDDARGTWESCHATGSTTDGGPATSPGPTSPVSTATVRLGGTPVVTLDDRLGRFVSLRVDGDALLLQHSGECEVPTAWLGSVDGTLRPAIAASDGTAVASMALGFVADGRALVDVAEAPCGDLADVEPGLYLVDPVALRRERIGDGGIADSSAGRVLGTWSSRSDRLVVQEATLAGHVDDGGDTVELVLDLVQVLTGEAAVNAALEAGVIDDPAQGLENDVHVRDLGTTARQEVPADLPVALDDILVAPLVGADTLPARELLTREFGPQGPRLAELLPLRLVLLDGEVVAITQLYLP